MNSPRSSTCQKYLCPIFILIYYTIILICKTTKGEKHDTTSIF